MPVHNNEIADTFDEIADFLELTGENPFRVRAYRKAAQTIKNLSRSAEEMVRAGRDLSELPGIGKALSDKIKTIIAGGEPAVLERLKKEIPPELGTLMKVSGLGPKRVKILYDTLRVKDIDELQKAAKNHRIRDLEGFGEKTEQLILEGIARINEYSGELKLPAAEQIIRPLLQYLKQAKGVKNIEIAGSNRRQKETVGDVDILVTCTRGSDIMDRFVGYEEVEKVISRGATKSSVFLRSGIQSDLRVVDEASFGAALLYFTGSKAHNIAIRKIAVKKNLKINEYGVFRGEKLVAGGSEKEVYRTIGLPFIEPELREDRGEIEAAQNGMLPHLIALDDIKGDLHTHTTITDGRYSLEEMVGAAQKKGYRYIANTEHSKNVTIARGLDADRLADLLKKIDRLNAKLKNITILKSIEVDILENGSLDLPDHVLKELDFTVCAVHYGFNLPKGKQTERIIRAMDNPYFTILAHPTGRLINERPPYDIDMERIMKAAGERGRILELNAHTEHLDLNDIHCKAAKEIGVKISISADAHSIDDLDLMRFGINQARRGWLEPGDVINTFGLVKLKKLFKRG